MEPNQTQNQKSKEKKPLDKAIKGNAAVKKPSKSRRFFELFINEDVDNVKEYLLLDLLVPAIKDTIVDTVQRTIEMLFYGRARGKKSGSSSYVSYASYSQRPRNDRPVQSRGKRISDLDSVEFESRADAENTVDILNELIGQYGEADVGDLYELIGVSGNGHVDRSFGWRTPIPYDIQYWRGTWILRLPRVIELN